MVVRNSQGIKQCCTKDGLGITQSFNHPRADRLALRNTHRKSHCKQERRAEQIEHAEALPRGGEEKQ